MRRGARLAAIFADFRARKLAEASAGVAARELKAIGCQVIEWTTGAGLTVNELDDAHLDPKRDAALRDLDRRGFSPLVVITRRNLGIPVPEGKGTQPHLDTPIRCAQSSAGTGSADEKRPAPPPRVSSTKKRTPKRTKTNG